MAHGKGVADVYKTVINDVLDGVREAFLDDGLDDQVLQELRQLWENKVAQSKAIEAPPPPPQPVDQQQIRFEQHLANHRQHQTMQQQLHLHHQHQQQQQRLMNQSTPVLNLSQHSQQHQQLNPQQVSMHMNMSRNQMTMPFTSQQHLSNLRHLGAGQYMVQAPRGQIFQSSQQFPVSTLHNFVTSNAEMSLNSNLTTHPVVQLDGLNDSSSEEEDDDADDDEENEEEPGEEEEPLNSADDISDTDPTEVFDVENVVVCQFDKINRSKNKWKFHLKDGIMNLNGRDYIFQKANGESEW